MRLVLFSMVLLLGTESVWAECDQFKRDSKEYNECVEKLLPASKKVMVISGVASGAFFGADHLLKKVYEGPESRRDERIRNAKEKLHIVKMSHSDESERVMSATNDVLNRPDRVTAQLMSDLQKAQINHFFETQFNGEKKVFFIDENGVFRKFSGKDFEVLQYDIDKLPNSIRKRLSLEEKRVLKQMVEIYFTAQKQLETAITPRERIRLLEQVETKRLTSLLSLKADHEAALVTETQAAIKEFEKLNKYKRVSVAKGLGRAMWALGVGSAALSGMAVLTEWNSSKECPTPPVQPVGSLKLKTDSTHITGSRGR